MKTIDHDPNERPRRPFAKGIWGAAWAMIAAFWGVQWYLDGFVWTQIALGAVTGILFAYTIVDYHIAIGKGHEL